MSEKITCSEILNFIWDEINLNQEFICPNCKNVSKVSEYIKTENYCEDCGSHSAIECPNCHKTFDNVWSDDIFLIAE